MPARGLGRPQFRCRSISGCTRLANIATGWQSHLVKLRLPPERAEIAPPRAWPAWAALVAGLAYAGISIYWGLGGTWLLDTVGGPLAAGGRSGRAWVTAAVWAAAGLKVIAAVVPVLAVGRAAVSRPLPWRRLLLVLAWAEAVILTLYGLVLTVVGLLVQSGLIRAGAGADHRALAWHAYLWDPWFLLWGLLVTAALLPAGRPRGAFPAADAAGR
jgi:hypothetical protein